MRNIIAGILCISELYRSIVGAISLRSEGVSRRGTNMLEMNVTRWKSCVSCKEKRPTSPEEIKLKLQDLKDNVDFHMNNFANKIKEKFDLIKESIDSSEVEHLSQACEKVEDKIREAQARIKSKCDNFADEVETKLSKQTYAEIVKKIENYKTLIKQFVGDGMDSLTDELNKVKQEFSAPVIHGTAENKHEILNPNDEKYVEPKKTTQNGDAATKPTETQPSLIQLKSHVDGHMESLTKGDVKNGNGVKSKQVGNKHNHDEEDTEDHDENRDKHDEHHMKEHNDEQDNDNSTADKHQQNDVTRNGERQKNTPENKEVKVDVPNIEKDKSYDDKTKLQKVFPMIKMSKEAQEAFDLAHIPPTAVTRTVQMYLQDLNAESSNLMRQILL